MIFSLLTDVSSFDKVSLINHFDDEVKNEEKLNRMIVQLNEGKPYQYVLGYSEFLGHKFYVNENVLIPRQETELLVLKTLDLIEKHFKNQEISILDMCSGSGIIGITISEKTGLKVDMVDISKEANETAKKNNDLNKTKCDIYLSDMFNDLPLKKYDVIISNPPYIKSEITVDKATLKYEPHLALFASPQTKFYEEIFKQYGKYYSSKFILAFEIDEDMKDDLISLINKYFKDDISYSFENDIYGKLRYLYIIG